MNNDKRPKPTKKNSQQDLIEFVTNPDNIKKAAEDSMQKRQDLIDRVAENNLATVILQLDKTRLTDEFDKNNLKSLLAEFEDAVYCTSGSSSVQNMAAEKRAIQAKSKIIAWHETEKQKSTKLVDRLEVIDHRECIWCRGRAAANYLQKDGSYKEQLCDKCDGIGTRGGRVYGAFSNPETSIIKVELSYQDHGKTLKVFVSDRELNENKVGKI